ncbi:MAG TPA: SMC family ATPase, partial [Herpetosiphonaceae bacterium]|nr:SMC family ATPase [Herpetosiphonaceae bacterium]
MIPHKLTVRNFMCYREDVPPLHFDGINVVCLSGENGAGKSALLDAMTWALWGRARAKSDDDLIALGQDEMEVDFEFVLDGTLRRVVRRRTRGKRGQTIVDFQMLDEQGAWRRVSGDGVRDTDAQIANALRMKYDTFINSAFLLQGRADEFTNRKPAERKQVLSDILGLAEYERLEERAKTHRNRCDEELRSLEGVIADHEAQVASRPFFVARLSEATELGRKLDVEVAAREEAAQQLRRESLRLRQLAETKATLELQVTQHAKELHELQQEVAAIDLRLKQAEAIVARRPEIEAGVARLDQVEERLAEFELLREEAYRLNDEKKKYDDIVRELRLDLEHAQRAAADELDALHVRASARGMLQAKLAELEAEASGFARLRDDLAYLREEQTTLEERLQQLADLRDQRARLQKPLDDMRTSRLADQSHLSQSIRDLELSAAQIAELEHDLEEVRRQFAQFQDVERRVEALREELRAEESKRANLREQCATLEKHGKEIKQKLSLIETGAGVCPVCEQPLDKAGQARLEAEYRAQRDGLRVEYATAKQAAAEAEARIEQGEAELQRLERTLGNRARLEPRHAKLEVTLAQAQADAGRLREQKAQLDTIERQLAEQDYGHVEREQLRAVDEALAALGKPAEVKLALDRVRKAIAETEKRLGREIELRQRMASIQEKLNIAVEAEAQLPDVQARLDEITGRLGRNEYGAAERAASEEILAQIHALGYTRVEHEQLRTEREELQKWRRELLELEHAEGTLEDTRRALQRSRELAERRSSDLEREREEVSHLEAQLRGRQAVELELAEAEQRLQTSAA